MRHVIDGDDIYHVDDWAAQYREMEENRKKFDYEVKINNIKEDQILEFYGEFLKRQEKEKERSF